MGRQWGIVTSVQGLTAGFVVESLSFAESVQTAEARTTDGRISDLAAYSKSVTLSASGLVDSSLGNLVTAGSSLTIDGKTYLIESVNKNETNTDFVRCDVSGRTADNAVIWTINGGTSSSSQE